ncbi:50S ribosomal protein L22 [Candidatus Termititenax spirochaetophilus]|uniref:Large ribosomal subunit protein uL22 n=1 Tax=Candidatus Termititenax spirochaetophilus TaxID=2218522 RepID=A0A388T9U9_9BACT|nr:50S ribosomal protein L22 [Candidatus Termititenax spirochaetophilus]
MAEKVKKAAKKAEPQKTESQKTAAAVNKPVKAEAKMLRIAPRKVDRVLKLIRGKKALEGLTILQFLPHSAARYTEKVLKSAIANAEHNNKLAKDSLVISLAVANGGTLLKRWRAGGKGRAQRIKKYTTHIKIAVKEGSK